MGLHCPAPLTASRVVGSEPTRCDTIYGAIASIRSASLSGTLSASVTLLLALNVRTRLSHQTPDTVSHTIFKAVGIEACVTRTHTRSDTSLSQLGASCTPAAPHAPAAPLNAFFDANAPTTAV